MISEKQATEYYTQLQPIVMDMAKYMVRNESIMMNFSGGISVEFKVNDNIEDNESNN